MTRRHQTLVSPFRVEREIFVISRPKTHAFPTCAAHFSAFLIRLSCRLCPIRPYGAPSPRGEGFVRRYSFFTYACIRFDVMGEAVFSYRSLPHWGRGTALAVDRVLS